MRKDCKETLYNTKKRRNNHKLLSVPQKPNENRPSPSRPWLEKVALQGGELLLVFIFVRDGLLHTLDVYSFCLVSLERIM
ncbi:hypothetical protein EYF80_019490 [Liparis tanakae]|uniref:Uncharacterized protein n=1 Tax=Liparis tanakae TaxID=230148 RepID=A0A4Z2HWP1_9TELE|nr:hypothetical protein EYF80_019490 [Liparis tanakae]